MYHDARPGKDFREDVRMSIGAGALATALTRWSGWSPSLDMVWPRKGPKRGLVELKLVHVQFEFHIIQRMQHPRKLAA